MVPYAIKSDVGVVRSENQDKAAVLQRGDQVLAILCDGMGGHAGGAHASRITIDVFEKAFSKPIPPVEINAWFQATIARTRHEMTVFAKGSHHLLDMGTTLTAALITKKMIYIFNIGDSRTYVYNGLLYQITKDHNLRNYYQEKYDYSPEEAAMITGAAALTSALGPQKTAKINPYVVEREANIKYVVLTSDGIHDYISKPSFEQLLANQKTAIDHKAKAIIKQAIIGKSSDNLTIVIVDLGAK